MPFIIKFPNNEIFEKEFGDFYGGASHMSIYNSIFTKIMNDYQDWHSYDFIKQTKYKSEINDDLYDNLFGTIFVNASERNQTVTFKFNLSFEQNKDEDDICTVEYLGCFELIEENLSRCEIDF